MISGVLFPVPRSLAAIAPEPPALFLPHERASERFFGFFTVNIRNKNTRRAYYKAAGRFSDWCAGRGLADLALVKPLHVAAYIEWLGTPEPKGLGLARPYGQTASGGATHAVRLVGGRPCARRQPCPCRARAEACGEERPHAGPDLRRGAGAARRALMPTRSPACATAL